MPRHNTPHHTDGPGIGKKLKGQELKDRLEYLTAEITKHHWKALESWQGFLNEAKEAGEGLLRVKRRLGHRLKWSKWRQRELIEPGVMSKETSLIYMRIAREWDSPQMLAARASGIKIDSINKFMEIVRNKPKKQDKPILSAAELRRSMYLDNVRKQFAEKLRGLTPYELDLLAEWGQVDELWDGLNEQLRLGVQVFYGEVYEIDREKRKEERSVKIKIKQALNTKHKAQSSKANTT
ncbi:hypothetical protein FYZ48_07070 [Gimesia chilikensis]|uniref:hypothetical protein n=1 Tax=Gimesia chilikensis TaxID=2605989 RepID=UPI0011EC2038|nr:hypothetical protein [Gimesia chilikensis]KAA0141027.1 hypothetical protein FYZ48_07070 [Gimesia chilikensis]